MEAIVIQILGPYDDLWLMLKKAFQVWPIGKKTRNVFINSVDHGGGLYSLQDFDNHPRRNFGFVIDGQMIYANQAAPIITEILRLREIPFKAIPVINIPRRIKSIIRGILSGKIKLCEE